jgi:hypothetical protein
MKDEARDDEETKEDNLDNKASLDGFFTFRN